MKLYLLRPREIADERNNPWEPWYDKSFGFVVRAETEADARQIAHENAGDENQEGRYGWQGTDLRYPVKPWLHIKYSICEELTADGDAGLIIQDVHAA